ncbi:MAG: helix-turn-helix domain-containing protein [Actinomycetota bacterium]
MASARAPAPSGDEQEGAATSETEGSDFLTPAQVAEWLNISHYTVLRAAREGGIPGARKIRNSWRFSRRILEQWFEARSSSPAGEPRWPAP